MKMNKGKWEVKTLGELGEIITGNTPSMKEKKYYSSKDYCFLKPGDIESNTISLLDKSESFVSKLGYEKSRRLSKGAVLVTCIGIIGKIGILDMPATCNQQINAIIPNELITSKFLAYSIFSNRDKLAMKANGPIVPIMNKSNFSKQSIPVPPLPEQQAIESELDAIHSLITKYKEQLNDYDNLAKSIFNGMFGDPQNFKSTNSITLGKACNLKAGKGIKASELINENKVGLYPCYGGNGIRGYINKYSNNEDSPIIGRQGALCGNVNFAKGKFYATEHAVVVTPKIKLNKIWLYYILTYLNLNRFAHGVAQPGLSVKDLIDISIPLAELELQQKFAARITAIEAQKDKVKQQIADLQTLFDSRMQYYFD